MTEHALGAPQTPHSSRDEVLDIGVGMLGHAFMGKAHSHAYRTIPHMMFPPTMNPTLELIAGRDEGSVRESAERYGYNRWTTSWQEMVADPLIELVDVCGPNSLHAEVCILAAQNGKHVICEKPLGRNAEESYRAWQAVSRSGVKHMCAFNYRFVPAIRLAAEMISAGRLGEIRHFRGRYLQDFANDPELPMSWRLERSEAGSGALGDLGAHLFDLARHLAGEVAAVSSAARTFIHGRNGGRVDVDDAFEAVIEFDSGAIGTLEASRVSPGHKNSLVWEINGSEGSIAFDLERLNELCVAGAGATSTHDGFQTILVSEPHHPFWEHWWPPGHIIGWEHTFVHELDHFLGAIAGDTDVGPIGATFSDGCRAAELCDAVLESAASGHRVSVNCEDLDDKDYSTN